MNIAVLKKILKTDAYLVLREYLTNKLMELRDIENIAEKDTPTHQAIELKSQKLAYKKLKDILDNLALIENIKLGKRDKRDDYFV
jgi:hypothetical protein